MKPLKKSEKVTPKGDRLNWTPLQEVKPVVLNPELTQGHKLDNTLSRFQGNSSNNLNLFVP
jgi:hypothetical protein